ncbi:Facilitated trehalose transporter Tret1 [Blattella germanica]|nr:Facilitated trehalose transporter Tret1 [Blattella germanica]
MSLIASGMSLGFPAISLNQLESEDGLSEDDGSWFASILSIATLFGCLLCGPLLDSIGRRKTLILMNAPFIIGWLLLCVAPSPAPLWLLYIGRILTGIGSGMVSIPSCVYIGEMSTDRLRGMLVTWPSICMSIGIELIYLIGWAIQDDWRLVAGIAISLPTLTTVLIFVFLKESPTWLLSRGRVEEAEVSFRWMREVGKDEKMPEEISAEFERLVESSKKAAGPQIIPVADAEQTDSKTPTESRFKTFKAPDFWKPLVIHNLYFFFMQFGGIQVVASYAVDIMKEANVTMEAYSATVLLGAVQVIGGIVASIAFNKCGRRPISLISGAGMAITMGGLGLYLEVSDGSEDLSAIPLLLILGYIGFAAIGFNLIPWGLLGELYPTKVAGVGGGITTCMANLMGFLAIKLYPGFNDLLKGDQPRDGGAFFFFGAVSCVGTGFVLFFLPETFRKSLDQISEEFRRDRKRKGMCC